MHITLFFYTWHRHCVWFWNFEHRILEGFMRVRMILLKIIKNNILEWKFYLTAKQFESYGYKQNIHFCIIYHRIQKLSGTERLFDFWRCQLGVNAYREWKSRILYKLLVILGNLYPILKICKSEKQGWSGACLQEL